jgi:hypothetical protein
MPQKMSKWLFCVKTLDHVVDQSSQKIGFNPAWKLQRYFYAWIFIFLNHKGVILAIILLNQLTII